MAKLRAAGMPEGEVLAAATVRPARILGLAGEVGVLAVGACADLAVLGWDEGAAPLVDAHGTSRPGGCWEALLTVRAGQVIPAQGCG
jgi:dihydroorotase